MLLTGIDIVEVERIAASLQNPAFYNKVYGKLEKEYLETLSEKRRLESAAAFFAAKEAFAKALGCGLKGFELSDVQVVHKPNGQPFYHISGKAKTLVSNLECEFSLSLSHTAKYAVASAIGFS